MIKQLWYSVAFIFTFLMVIIAVEASGDTPTIVKAFATLVEMLLVIVAFTALGKGIHTEAPPPLRDYGLTIADLLAIGKGDYSSLADIPRPQWTVAVRAVRIPRHGKDSNADINALLHMARRVPDVIPQLPIETTSYVKQLDPSHRVAKDLPLVGS